MATLTWTAWQLSCGLGGRIPWNMHEVKHRGQFHAAQHLVEWQQVLRGEGSSVSRGIDGGMGEKPYADTGRWRGVRENIRRVRFYHHRHSAMGWIVSPDPNVPADAADFNIKCWIVRPDPDSFGPAPC